MDIFVTSRHKNPVLTLDDTLVTAIRHYKNASDVCARKLIFDSNGAAKGIRPIDIKKALLMLRASNIIGLSLMTKKKDDDANSTSSTESGINDDGFLGTTVTIHCFLQHDNGRVLHLNIESYWTRIPTR